MLTDFLLAHGVQFFASGWTQFAVAFGIDFNFSLKNGLTRYTQGNKSVILRSFFNVSRKF